MNNRVAKLLSVCGWNPLPVGLVAPLLFSLRAISEHDIVFHSAEFGDVAVAVLWAGKDRDVFRPLNDCF